MRVKIFAAAAALLFLAACESGTSGSGGVIGSGSGPVLANPPGTGQAGIGQAGAPRGVVPGSQEDLQQSVGDRIFFASDRTDLTPEARRTVDGWAMWLRQNPGVSATIEGHADERGTREYNLALGERRALSVRDKLMSLGISGDRITTISYGKEKPAVVGNTEEAYAKNRRGVFVLLTPPASVR